MNIQHSMATSFSGLSDNLREGRFKFFDGLRFKPGVCVPINANGGMQENCVAWSIEKPEGCWEDRPCSEKIPYTCRTPVEGNKTENAIMFIINSDFPAFTCLVTLLGYFGYLVTLLREWRVNN